MWGYRVAAFLKFCMAFLLALTVLFPVLLLNATSFPFEADKEYYLYSPSSQAEISKDLEISELPYICGECVRVETSEGDSFAVGLISDYCATVVKTETFDGGVSYYCYSPKFKGGILLDGNKVNLHIVVKGGEVLLGTPIVFGGY